MPDAFDPEILKVLQKKQPDTAKRYKRDNRIVCGGRSEANKKDA